MFKKYFNIEEKNQFNEFPTIEELVSKKVNSSDYQIDGYIFLGYTNEKLESEIDGILQKELTGNRKGLYGMYMDENIKENMKIIGMRGVGKSLLLHNFLDSYMNNINSIDKFIVHDFKTVESYEINRFVKKNDKYRNKLIGTSKMEELNDVLTDLEKEYQIRKDYMMNKGITNYDGKKIFLVLDDFNCGFSDLESKDEFKRKLAEDTEQKLINAVKLYRPMGIYINIMGSSSLQSDNFHYRLNKQTSVTFQLRNSGFRRKKLPDFVYEDIGVYNIGQVLYINHNNEQYFKFLARYTPDDYLEKFK